MSFTVAEVFVFLCAGFAATYLVGEPALLLLVPFFALSAGDPGGSGSSGGTGGTGGTGSSSADSQRSTPFLCVWDGGKFVFDNDFLLGTTTFYLNEETGRSAYEGGRVSPDLYRVRNEVSVKDGALAFQIREVEAEESFIDVFTLSRAVYPARGELVVDSKHGKFYVFDKEELARREGVVSQSIFVRGKEADGALCDLSRVGGMRREDAEYCLEAGDTLEIRGRAVVPAAPLFLLVGSRYRDWTPTPASAGEFPQKGERQKSGRSPTPSPFQERLVFYARGAFWSGAFLLFAGAAWLFGAVGTVVNKVFTYSTGERSVGDDGRLLAERFGIPRVYADFPHDGGGGGGHSLLVESYFDWERGSYVLEEVISPRHVQYSVDAVALPKRAVSKDGEVRIRITATKRHYVGLASLFAPKKKLGARVEKLAVRKAFHNREQRDHAEVLQKERSGGYLHTIAGDIVDVEFAAPREKVEKNEQASYLLGAGGFYTPLSEDGRKISGNWAEKLDDDSRALLCDMQAA